MQLEDWLDDLCVRFIINLPPEELESVERICFQVEEAQWFYEDFIRPLDPSLPSLSLRAFSLRIFQHCPLFSQWSAQHHTTAFAEFLAYKSRVPVRGAILLNESMDEVVLVKGWKKSANWSFPRGKINKDENDLDCAVREVYEETGFDIREAGLVKDEKDMKYIEVTMREQHMRLYVFRGVPRDAHFEPRTRKEISKIEWYKLTDLPTLKKNNHRQHEGSGTDPASLNANKFYMVAPFLNPLKKWIAQQRKKENRYSSHLAAPPMVPEDVTTEDEQNGVGARAEEPLPLAVSDLPEVSDPPAVDPSSHLKGLLHIGGQAAPPQAALPPSHMPQVDTEKSNALLALLRGDLQGQPAAIPRTPLEQISLPPEVQPSPQISHVRQPQIDQAQPPPPFQPRLQDQVLLPAQPFQQRSNDSIFASNTAAYPSDNTPRATPFQRTTDPLFGPGGAIQHEQATIPPASALPKLTNHTKALLDVFKGATSPSIQPLTHFETPAPNALSRVETLRPLQVQRQNMPPNNPLTADHAIQGNGKSPAPWTSNALFQPTANAGFESQVSSMLPSARPRSAQQTSLLQLFTQPSPPKPTESSIATRPPPVELAATAATTSSLRSKVNKDDLLSLLGKSGRESSRNAAETKRPNPREGETSATISGPLNQPEFEVISRATRHATNEMGRSPLPANRTLYDPNQPAPVKILTRSEESRSQPPRSPRGAKSTSRRAAKERAMPKEQAKPFQPQILRRPQTVEAAMAGGLTATSEAPNQQPISTAAAASPPAAPAGFSGNSTPAQKPSQTEAQKQTLLSLFGGGLDTAASTTTLPPNSGIVSPLTSSQIFNASGEMPLSGTEPISTRTSRVGSMASIVSGPGTGRAAGEKRQTGAENKAFLLGYLGRIASQEQ
ncbi:uncharacterized protein Z520_00478 [Fonsecaea multimorphosa CBS 102226]|uniref:Nudix hydrolase domain-containing protein n=1 Tax=Fonsecaea multimorphosa CBS 102226 TaxID=1442371 RepID=A0A0D2J2X3_9EURO|nr:uncharacterized protein Z520_00478 [Fonsecaea multimorphosa CBS 102226]KIY03787.1 hypothetical protein Z520_00478 [Fonsecaea multimorphosa CBS 102226]OAL32480.1 hypothetical protein AYO22_00502 [Fonsecaea multimorphosa]